MKNQEELFNIYSNELIEWNNKFNLTSITNPEDIKVKHFEDSLSLGQVVEFNNQSVVDVGTGAGFPGIPLKIKYPNLKLTLIEATKKKTEFLNHIINRLNLSEVEIFWGRAEEIALNLNNSFDVALSRAVAKLNILAELCLPMVKVGGIFLAQKKHDCQAEVMEAKTAINRLGGRIKEIKTIELDSGKIKHAIIIIEKKDHTPRGFPRPMREIKNKPL